MSIKSDCQSGLVLDLLCLDSMVIILLKGYIKEYDRIGYCRTTWLGSAVLKILPTRFSRIFKHYIDPFNEIHDESNVGSVREVMVGELMNTVSMTIASKLSKLLKVDRNKLEDTYKVQTWDAYFHQTEAILRAKHSKYDVLCWEVLPFPVNLCGEVKCYRRRIDFSKIIPRKNYNSSELCYDIRNRWFIVTRELLTYLAALAIYPISALFYRKEVEKRDVIVDVTRRCVDRNNKSDIFWMDKDSYVDKTLLLKNTPSRQVGVAKNIPSIGYSPSKIWTSKECFFLLNHTICNHYLKSFKLYCLLLMSIFNSKEGQLLLFGTMRLFKCKAIIEAYSAKVLVSNHSFSNSSEILACSILGIVSVRGTWSNQFVSHPHLGTSVDVFFAWGDVTVETYSKSGAKNTTFVKTGFIDGELMNLKDETQNVSFLNQHQGKCILGFFDNISSYERPNRVKDLHKCFELLSELLKENDNLVVVYKPKTGDLKELYKTDSFSQVSFYIEQERFIILCGERNVSNRPAEISGIMDIVLGFPFSSAAVETAIAGTPSFHVDFSEDKEHPWLSNCGANYIFDSINNTKINLSKYIRDMDKLNSISDEHIKGVNYYNDYCSKERMQMYIEALCDGDNILVSQRILNANKKFRKNFCSDNLCIKEPSIFH